MARRSIERGVRSEFSRVQLTTRTPAGSLNGGTTKDSARRDGAARGLSAIVDRQRGTP